MDALALKLRGRHSVSEYVASFTSLTDQLIAYNSGVDPVYFVTRFIDGLKPELRSILLVQRPKSLDAACTLALLQEEAGGVKDSARNAYLSPFKLHSKPSYPIPPPPTAAKPAAQPATASAVSTTASAVSESDSKLVALKAYRRAMGLCYKGAAKWTKDHKCAPEILHAVQDLWESLSIAADMSSGEDSVTPSETLLMAVSDSAVSGAPAIRTIQFIGSVDGLPVTILLDSGSTSSFVSDSLVQQLTSQTILPHKSSVSVAGGALLFSKGILHNVTWSIDSHAFTSDFKILPLAHFDIILVPIFDQLMDELANAKWFSTLDLRAGFHQILLQSDEEHKIAFQTHLGSYEFRVMAFGLNGSPSTFQGAMNSTLAPGLRKFVLVFFDEILSSIAYLGHVISSTGISTDPAKIKAIQDWPVPSNVKQLTGFLGLVGYYRKFVRNFGIIAKPLTELLCKDAVFTWAAIHNDTFQLLKTALVSAPCLALPDFSLPFHIETDASAVGVGAVLLQQGHP
ncbi:uncharacterized protein [Miscanthus floridulus]|uniref:uncharacterized protein n=1 Tax=Miscanthus floridulus TaxID=154761 RepID=UPI0034599851